MAVKYSKLTLVTFLAMILVIQSIAIMPIKAQEIEVEPAINNDPSGWYTLVNGNLHNDRYDLYPYEHDASVTLGFSRFGELINSQDSIRVGLEYRHNDPFAPPSGAGTVGVLPPKEWLEGWLINITYVDGQNHRRNIWATAQHADKNTVGNNWIRVDDDYQDQVIGVSVTAGGLTGTNNPGSNNAEHIEDPADNGCAIDLTNPGSINCNIVSYGGRKTNGTALSGPIEVLYNGPRRYVAVTNTTIYDVTGNPNDALDSNKIGTYNLQPLVDIVFTIDFNKVTKEVNVIKDIKAIPQAKFSIGNINIEVPEIDYDTPLDGQYNNPVNANYRSFSIPGLVVSFSNRGEFDLKSSNTDDYNSFVHFYTYAASHDNDTSNEILPTEYNNEYTLLRTLPPLTRFSATSVPLNNWGLEPAGPAPVLPTDGKTFGTFDVAQIISRSSSGGLGDTVAWAAFWPSLSDWDVEGGIHYWWQSLENTDPHRIDGTSGTPPEPFRSPYIIGEWDFLLLPLIESDGAQYDDDTGLEGDKMFRAVTQYGVVDRHNEIVSTNNINAFPLFTCADVPGANNLNGLVPYGRGSDDDATDSINDDNILDPEVAYYLRMKFCPWDLVNAAEKASQRHLIRATGPSIPNINLGVDPSDLVGITNTGGNNNIVGDTTREGEEWRAYSTFAERVVNNGVLLTRGIDYVIDVSGTPASIQFTPAVSGTVEVYFSVDVGSYEWVAVGRDSHVVDSAAASMVSSGFIDILGIHTLWAALDMRDNSHLTPQFLMAKFGSGNTRADYHYSNTDNRSALKKYWSTTIPISSSNIIAVGGPGANLVTEYFNEFMPAIYRGNFFGVADLLLVPSWDALGTGNEKPIRLTGQNTVINTDQTKYNITDNVAPQIIPVNEQDYGWAVIATYKDINGTVGFTIWGATGNDSFWAAQAFQNGLSGDVDDKESPLTIEKVIHDDTNENGPSSDDPVGFEDRDSLAEALLAEPNGVSAIVLWIDYSTTSIDGGYHPTIRIVEELGTISETPQHDP